MANDDQVTLVEPPGQVRRIDVAYAAPGAAGPATVARLYVAPGSARLYFDGDVRPEVMQAVIAKVTRECLAGLPPGVCVIARGHVVSSLVYGADDAGGPASGPRVTPG